MAKFDRRGNGPWFYLGIILIVFLAYCAAIAVGTAEDCGSGVAKDWSWTPPKWECKGHLAGYG